MPFCIVDHWKPWWASTARWQRGTPLGAPLLAEKMCVSQGAWTVQALAMANASLHQLPRSERGNSLDAVMADALVSWGCGNEPSQSLQSLKTVAFKQHWCIVSQFWRPEVQNQGVSRTTLTLKPIGVDPLLSLSYLLTIAGKRWFVAVSLLSLPPLSHGRLPRVSSLCSLFL